MRLVAGSAWQRLRGKALVVLAGLVACAFVFLEATEAGRREFLPAGALDTAVDAALGCMILVAGGCGAAELLVQRRAHAGDGGASRSESEASRTMYRTARRALSSENPFVRLRALQDLEFLGQATPAYRERVVALWCSYLRRAAGRWGERTERSIDLDRCFQATPSSIDEITLQTEAQRLIALHLREVDQVGLFATYWPEIRVIDLEGAHLVELDLRGCVLPHAAFGGAVFHGDTIFDGARFAGEAAFDEAIFFDKTSFERVMFERDVAFCAARFGNDVAFTGSTFGYTALFVAAGFASKASFREAEFRHEVDFSMARTGATVDLSGSRIRSGYRHHTPQGWVADDDGSGWASIVPA